MSNHKMRIMLLGPSGVGKTTLLAGLTKEMKTINESNKYTILCTDSQKDNDLKEIEKNLAVIKDDDSFTPREVVTAMRGNVVPIKDYPFTLQKEGRKLIDIEVIDHKGGDIAINSELNPNLREEIRKANVIINVIDGTYLMVDEYGSQDAEINQYSSINQHIVDRLNHSTMPLLVIFVITKCEKWARDHQKNSESYQNLLEKAQKRLASSLHTIKENALNKGNVVAVLLPVITINSVEFHSATQSEDNAGVVRYQPKFFKNPRYAYEPKATLPLKLALSFSMTHMESTLIDKIKYWFNGTTDDIEKAIDDFANKDLNIPNDQCYGALKLLSFKK